MRWPVNFRMLLFYLMALLMLTACWHDDDSPAGQAAELIGTWVICWNELGIDKKEIHFFDGSAGNGTAFSYSSTDGSCSTGELLDYYETFTYVTGGTLSASLSGSTVNATRIDVNFKSTAFYSIFYIDTSSNPHELYMGDENAAPALNASTPDHRPDILLTLPRLKQ